MKEHERGCMSEERDTGECSTRVSEVCKLQTGEHRAEDMTTGQSLQPEAFYKNQQPNASGLKLGL